MSDIHVDGSTLTGARLEVFENATEYANRKEALADSREALIESLTRAYADGTPELQLSKISGVCRGTVRRWLGKPHK